MPTENNTETSGFRLNKLFGTLNGASEVENSAGAPASNEIAAPAPNGQSANGQQLPGQMYRRTGSASNPGSLVELRQELEQARDQLDEMSAMLGKLLERKPVDQSVFDTLHEELRDYKNDFFYERLKPIVRAFLFVFDSLESFEKELAAREANGQISDPETFELTQQNLMYFRQQLCDAFGTCEAFPIEVGNDFDPALHRPLRTVSVSAAQNNQVQSVLRSGWRLNGAVLRPAEVVRGVA